MLGQSIRRFTTSVVRRSHYEEGPGKVSEARLPRGKMTLGGRPGACGEGSDCPRARGDTQAPQSTSRGELGSTAPSRCLHAACQPQSEAWKVRWELGGVGD